MPDTATSRGTATRERIVAAAADLMYRNGAAGTTTPAVRTAAGVSSSQIYHYFNDKDALTLAVIDWWSTRIAEEQIRLLARVRDADGLHRWRNAVVRAAGDYRGCPLGGLAAELSNEAWARSASSQGFAQWQAAIGHTLTRLVERGVLADDTEVDRHGLAMLSAIQGGLLLSKATRSTAALEAGLDAALSDLLTQHGRQ